MKNGMEIPRAVIVVVVVVALALIVVIGRKVIFPPQRVQMSQDAIQGMKEHTAGQGSGGAPTMQPGMGSTQHSK